VICLGRGKGPERQGKERNGKAYEWTQGMAFSGCGIIIQYLIDQNYLLKFKVRHT